jgi:hypothetical protein
MIKLWPPYIFQENSSEILVYVCGTAQIHSCSTSSDAASQLVLDCYNGCSCSCVCFHRSNRTRCSQTLDIFGGLQENVVFSPWWLSSRYLEATQISEPQDVVYVVAWPDLWDRERLSSPLSPPLSGNISISPSFGRLTDCIRTVQPSLPARCFENYFACVEVLRSTWAVKSYCEPEAANSVFVWRNRRTVRREISSLWQRQDTRKEYYSCVQ